MPVVPDLIVVGNLIVDDLVFPDGTTRMGEPGGAVVYTALGAALWGARIGLVSIAGADYPESMLDALHARGIDLAGLQRLPHPGLRAWLLYEPGGRNLVYWRGRPTHADGSPGPDAVPTSWRDASAIHLTPAPLATQAELVRRLSGSPRARLSLDPHTPVTVHTLERWRQVLASVDVFFVSESELQVDVNATTRMDGHGPAPALQAWVEDLCRGRLRTVAMKRGDQGGTLYAPPAPPMAWPARSAAVIDPTGCGDAFAGGMLAARLAGASPRVALEQAIVSASFAMEAWGAAGLLAATPEAARLRLAEWFGQDG